MARATSRQWLPTQTDIEESELLGGSITDDSDPACHSANPGHGKRASLSVQPKLGILSQRHAGNDPADRVDSVPAALRVRSHDRRRSGHGRGWRFRSEAVRLINARKQLPTLVSLPQPERDDQVRL